jgi:hypothetical protein
LEYFGKNVACRDGKMRKCRECVNADVADCLCEVRASVQARLAAEKLERATTRETVRRRRWLKSKYDITLEQYRNMLDAQGGVCAICGKNGTRLLDVDHDHTTGAIRGLLCSACNQMLGHAYDDPATLLAGARYLQRSEITIMGVPDVKS